VPTITASRSTNKASSAFAPISKAQSVSARTASVGVGLAAGADHAGTFLAGPNCIAGPPGCARGLRSTNVSDGPDWRNYRRILSRIFLGGVLMRICWQSVVTVFFALSTASGALIAEEIESDMFASMAGKCSTLKVAERDFACTSIAFSHSPGGRSGFTVPLIDPDDDSHIITFSGENGRRNQDNTYELSLDRVLLKSKDSPKASGLPIPSIELSTGRCKQIGNFAMQRVTSVACVAIDERGKKYELQFESDGSPIKVKMIRVEDPEAEERRAKVPAAHVELLKCQQLADLQGVLRRDRTDFILRCMER
jgi:hypothetical protein